MGDWKLLAKDKGMLAGKKREIMRTSSRGVFQLPVEAWKVQEPCSQDDNCTRKGNIKIFYKVSLIK